MLKHWAPQTCLQTDHNVAACLILHTVIYKCDMSVHFVLILLPPTAPKKGIIKNFTVKFLFLCKAHSLQYKPSVDQPFSFMLLKELPTQTQWQVLCHSSYTSLHISFNFSFSVLACFLVQTFSTIAFLRLAVWVNIGFKKYRVKCVNSGLFPIAAQVEEK